MKKTLLILCAAAMLFTMCKTRDQREKLLQEITQEEQKIFSKDHMLTLEESQRLMDLYVLFAKDYPEDPLSPDLLFRCANMALNSQQEVYAITLYKRVYDEYPDHALRPVALLNQALVYDNMGNVERAKPLYELFLETFPDDPYVTDVEHLLEMVDKSPEEWEAYMRQLDTLMLD